MARWIAFVTLAGFFLGSSAAQDKKKPAPKIEPRIVLAIPLGAAPGKTTKLTLRGVDLDNATEVKVLDGKGSVKILGKGKAGAPDKNPERVGDTQVEIELKLNDNLVGTGVAVAVVTKNGATKPHSILIEPALAEKEPNDGFRSAQVITLPVIIAGAIHRPRDVDLFRFEGKKGQTLFAEVLSARYGAPVDSMLTLYDANRREIAVNDDFTKDHQDPRIEMVLPADGVYFLSLLDAHDSGSNLHVYRLVVK